MPDTVLELLDDPPFTVVGSLGELTTTFTWPTDFAVLWAVATIAVVVALALGVLSCTSAETIWLVFGLPKPVASAYVVELDPEVGWLNAELEIWYRLAWAFESDPTPCAASAWSAIAMSPAHAGAPTLVPPTVNQPELPP
jgi:hypothetical protein